MEQVLFVCHSMGDNYMDTESIQICYCIHKKKKNIYKCYNNFVESEQWAQYRFVLKYPTIWEFQS
jgi:hypothetical protein